MTTIELIGYVGGILLAFSGLPQAVKSVWEGKTGDISHGLLWMWVVGEGFMFVYATVETPTVQLLMNFGFNFFLVGVITWYKYFPRKRQGPRRTPLRRSKRKTPRQGRIKFTS